jgi:hypothetical protein
MRRSFACTILAIAVLTSTTNADAQQQTRQVKDQRGDQAIAARQECFQEAQQRHPGQAFASTGLADLRTSAYMDCARRKGVRP